MKSYNELKSEIKTLKLQLVEARKRERLEAQKRVRTLCKKFNFSNEEVKSRIELSKKQIIESGLNERSKALNEVKHLCDEFGVIAEKMDDYEERQNFNFITQILHTNRYRHLKKIIEKISKSKKRIKVIDIGCGSAKTFSFIKQMGVDFVYLGIEPSEDLVDIANNRYSQFDNFSIICDSVENTYASFENVDLILAMESFEHIREATVIRIIENITKRKFKYMYITVPNEIGPAILIKNVGSYLMGWKRYREYKWRETLASAFYKLDKFERHSTRHKGFDWRWLAQNLRQNCKIKKITTSPLNVIPMSFSPSIGFICEKD